MQACEPVCRIDRQWKWSPHVVQSWCQASNKRWAKSIAKPSRKTHSRNPTSVESNLHKFWRTCQGASSPCITGASQSLQRWSRNPHTTTKNSATVALHLDEHAKISTSLSQSGARSWVPIWRCFFGSSDQIIGSLKCKLIDTRASV